MATLQVTLTDVNDARPVIDPFDCPCWIQENQPPGQTCQHLTAHDLEVAKYLRKCIREVNHEIEERDYDEMIPYKDEGQFEPLGSIGSLYDILAEADGEHSVLGSPHKQISPTRPSPFTRSPPKLRSPHKLRPPPTEPPPPYQNLSVYNQPMSGLAPVHSRDHSKSSTDEPHRGDYNRKLDRLFEHFHTMTTDFSSELYQDHDIVEKRLI